MSGVSVSLILLAEVGATRVQLAPDVIDSTAIPDAAGTMGLLFAAYGAAHRFGPDRLGRITLFGNLLGGVIASGFFLLGLVLDVLS
jgi:hypothetical protein